MKPELVQAAATIAVEILRRVKTSNGELTEDVIGSAFEVAALGLAEGMARVRRNRPKMNISQADLDLLS